jgi:small subunit ribosomal protein S6
LQKGKGHVLTLSDWGKRKLAYRVEKATHGHYFYLQFLDPGQSISEIERILRNDDRVLKFLTVKLREKINVEERLAQPVSPLDPPEELIQHEEYDRGAGRGRPNRYSSQDAEGDEPMDLSS